jgi:hypothetical protein
VKAEDLSEIEKLLSHITYKTMITA